MINPVRACHGGRFIGGAIIHDQPFDHVESSHDPRQCSQRDCEGSGFIQTGNLDDQLHQPASFTRRPGSLL